MKVVNFLKVPVTFLIFPMLLALPGFTCSKNIPRNTESSKDYDLIAYKGTNGETISYRNTRAECNELKSKLEEKNPDVVYRCR